MSTDPEFLQNSVDHYQSSAKNNMISSRLSQGLAVSMGAIAGLGISLVIEGQPVGVLATGVGGYLSWRFAGLAAEEVSMAEEDRAHASAYEDRLAQLSGTIED